MTKYTVILVYPKVNFEDNYPCSWLPYSLLAIASSLSTEKYNIHIFDENRNNLSDFDKLLKNSENILCVGFSIMTGGGQICNALELASLVRSYNPSIKIVFGGPHVNVLAKETLSHPLVDITLKGPGQNSFPLLCQSLENNNHSLNDIPGIFYKADGHIECGPDNVLTAKTMTPYRFSDIDVNQYIQSDSTIGNRTINYIASQGCAYRCRFCYETNYKQKYFKLPFEYFARDINLLINQYGVNGIKFYDADWFLKPTESDKMIDELIKYNISWAASIHPKDVLTAIHNDRPLLKKLSISRCKRLLMGIESGCNRVLQEIVNKLITKEEIFEVAQCIAKHNILGSYTFIVGFPGETSLEQDETFDFIRQLWDLNPRPETRVHIYTPYPGTAMYETAIQKGFKPPHDLIEWSQFDYYKSMTPWTDETLERKVRQFTQMIPK